MVHSTELSGSKQLFCGSGLGVVARMRVFVLGGAGLMGSEVVRDLLNEPDIDEVSIAELDVTKAEQLAAELDDNRVSVVPVDIRNIPATALLARGYDLVMNCTFFGLFGEALEVACEAGVNYADLLSTPLPEHYERAKAAGITAISGLGATPGMTNILSRMGCEWFDTPESVEISWASFRPIAHSPGLLGGMFWQMGPECPTRQFFSDGRFFPAGPFEGSKLVDFAVPIGRRAVYLMAHTETVALPKRYPDLRFVCVRGTWRPSQMEALRTLGALGLMDFTEQNTKNGPVVVADFVMDRIQSARGGIVDDEGWGFFLNIDVTGISGGQRGHMRFKISHPDDWRESATAKMTGIPAAVQGAIAMRRCSAGAGIVDATEFFDDPDGFLDALRSRDTIQIDRTLQWE